MQRNGNVKFLNVIIDCPRITINRESSLKLFNEKRASEDPIKKCLGGLQISWFPDGAVSTEQTQFLQI